MRGVKITKNYMNVNVILTFNTSNQHDERQEFFDLKLAVSKKETSADLFMHSKLFKKIVAKCKKYNRTPEDLIKISTASDWRLFKKATGLPSLWELGHPCKWYFGTGRDDLDEWEQALMKIYGFGTKADLSHIFQMRDLARKKAAELAAA